MTFLLITVFIITCIILIINNKKKPKHEQSIDGIVEKPNDILVESSNDDILPDRVILYNYLMSKLNEEFLRIEKDEESLVLQKQVKIAEHDFEQLQMLKIEVEKIYTATVNELADRYFNAAEIYINKKSTYNMALSFYDKAIDLIKDPMYYNNRGCLYHKMGELLVAIDDYNRAIKLNPNNGQYYYNRGGAYYTLGQKKNALNDLHIASKMGIVEAEKLLQFYF